MFCLLLPPPRPDHDHENDRDCNNDCNNFAGIGLEIYSIRFTFRSFWKCGIKGTHNAGLFLVFGTLSADVQQTPRCLMVVKGMFSRPAGALEGHRSTMQTLHETSHESMKDAFLVWIVRVYLALVSSFPATSHVVEDHPKGLIPLLMDHQVGIKDSSIHTLLNEPLSRGPHLSWTGTCGSAAKVAHG